MGHEHTHQNLVSTTKKKSAYVFGKHKTSTCWSCCFL